MSSFDPISALIITMIILGIIMLQVHLSKKEGKWLGLILPGLNFFFSLIVLVGVAEYTLVGTENEVVSNPFISVIGLFIYLNIATVLFLIIYFHYGKKKKKLSEIDKMNIQDLN